MRLWVGRDMPGGKVCDIFPLHPTWGSLSRGPESSGMVSNEGVSPSLQACHILECCDGLAQDVIGSIGQAFELRFKQYLQCPSKIPALQDR